MHLIGGLETSVLEARAGRGIKGGKKYCEARGAVAWGLGPWAEVRCWGNDVSGMKGRQVAARV